MWRLYSRRIYISSLLSSQVINYFAPDIECDVVCLFARMSKNHTSKLHEIVRILLAVVVTPMRTMQYVMYFRFRG